MEDKSSNEGDVIEQNMTANSSEDDIVDDITCHIKGNIMVENDRTKSATCIQPILDVEHATDYNDKAESQTTEGVSNEKRLLEDNEEILKNHDSTVETISDGPQNSISSSDSQKCVFNSLNVVSKDHEIDRLMSGMVIIDSRETHAIKSASSAMQAVAGSRDMNMSEGRDQDNTECECVTSVTSTIHRKHPVSLLCEISTVFKLSLDIKVRPLDSEYRETNDFEVEVILDQRYGEKCVSSSREQAKCMACEMLLRKIYRDVDNHHELKYFDVVRAFCEAIPQSGHVEPFGNPVGELQRLVNKVRTVVPDYEVTKTHEQTFNKAYHCTLRFGSIVIEAHGTSKKLAKRQCCSVLLRRLRALAEDSDQNAKNEENIALLKPYVDGYREEMSLIRPMEADSMFEKFKNFKHPLMDHILSGEIPAYADLRKNSTASNFIVELTKHFNVRLEIAVFKNDSSTGTDSVRTVDKAASDDSRKDAGKSSEVEDQKVNQKTRLYLNMCVDPVLAVAGEGNGLEDAVEDAASNMIFHLSVHIRCIDDDDDDDF